MATDLHIQAPVFTSKNVCSFTGKEWCKNQWLAQRGLERGISETGYSYIGARYMDHELTTSFLSIDRYADKYPSIPPYAYCARNPIKLMDPTGDTVVLSPGAMEMHLSLSSRILWKKRSKTSQNC